ncbi:unnamed protein product [Dovyalis caffra]|uniref:Endonuclease V n=1 Tax=Dovyalis caffra TaxID=77055 RepID=A0AAV1SQ68_9ROSI|nr:unnamed protein product [Dovyalis caffra]
MDGQGQGPSWGEPSSSTPAPASASTIQIQNQWREIQDLLKQRLITEDDFPWKLPTPTSSEEALLKYVGGVDVSYSKELDSAAACGCGSLVVLDLTTLQVVYQDFSILTDFHVPYIPAFLAFREAPILLQLLQKMKNTDNPFYPQLLLVDGNGLLHPRGKLCFLPFSIESSFLRMRCITYSYLSFTGFGLACHLGVLANIPTIGIGKNLHHVDGLTQSGVRQLLQTKDNSVEDFVALKGSSGCIWGAAMTSTKGSLKPIYISVGHRVSLDTAIKIVKMSCKYRVPEPIRQLHHVDGLTQSGVTELIQAKEISAVDGDLSCSTCCSSAPAVSVHLDNMYSSHLMPQVWHCSPSQHLRGLHLDFHFNYSCLQCLRLSIDHQDTAGRTAPGLTPE